MTSRKSSANPFLYTFKSGLGGSNLVPALLNGAALLILSTVVSVYYLAKQSVSYNEAGEIIGSLTAKDQFKYLIFPLSDVVSMFALAVTVVAAVFMGISAFRFITSKKTVNVYYSLGITRDKLFAGRYLSGAALLALTTALPFVFTYIANVIFIGGSAQLSAATLYYILMFVSISLTTYTITAAVFSSVGTSFEGVFFSGVLLFVPTIFFTCLQFLMSKFVYGNPYGEIFAYMGTRSYMQDSEMLSTRFEFLSPILHNITELSNYGAYDPKLEINPAMTMSQGVPYTAPNYLPAIIWLIFSAAVFFVGMFIFQKRKAEICGFIGMNKYLNSVVPFLLGFFAFTVCLYKLPLSILVCGIIGIVLYFIIYCAIDLALKRNLKAFLKGMIKFPVHAAVTLIITAIFATGLFGFSSRLPDLKDIQSADIAPVGNTELFAGAGNYFGSSSSVNYASFGGLIADYVSESDIKAILELHKKLIDGGIIEETKNGEYIADDSQRNIPSTVQFVYKLKNGKTFMRDYNVVNAQTLTDMLQIDVLERTKEKLVQAFDKAEYEKITKQIKKENHNPYMTYDYRLYEKLVNLYATNINLKLFTADGTTAVGLNISYEERIQLIEALKKDLLEQTVEERYFPTAPALFTLNFLAQAGDDDAMTEKYGGTASIIDPSATSPEASEAEEPEAPPEKIAPETNLQTVSPDNVAGNLYTITADMTNTIELIKALGAEEYTVTKPKIVKAQIISVERYTTFNPWMYEYQERNTLFFNYTYVPFFDESKLNGMYYGESLGGEFDSRKSYELTDAATLESLWNMSRHNYYTKFTGYYVRFTLADKAGTITMFIPKASLPEDIAKSVIEFDASNPSPDHNGVYYAY